MANETLCIIKLYLLWVFIMASSMLIWRTQSLWGRMVIPIEEAPDDSHHEGCRLSGRSCPSVSQLGITRVWVLHLILQLTFILCINDCKFQGHKHVEENWGWGRTVLSHPHYYTPNSIGCGIKRVTQLFGYGIWEIYNGLYLYCYTLIAKSFWVITPCSN